MELPTINMKRTGESIENLRKQRNLSVQQLQQLLGIATPQAVYKWQRGETLPSVENLVALSRIFSVPMEGILAIEDGKAE